MPFSTLLNSGVLVFGLCTFLAPSLSFAEPIDSRLSIIGTTSLADTDPDLATATWSADLYSVVGGVTSVGAATNVELADIGDAFGHSVALSGALSGANSPLTLLGGDYKVTASNTSSDTFRLTFGILFRHTADSNDGDLDADARSRSELEVTDASDSEYLFSRLTSESGEDYFVAGNPGWQDQIHEEVSDTFLGTWGDALSFGEYRSFEVLLTGSASFEIISVFNVEGRAFDGAATFSATSSMILILQSVENLSKLDTDEDGISDAEDNCPLIPNPDQDVSISEPGRGAACEGLPPGC
jgi:hypothetical protein